MAIVDLYRDGYEQTRAQAALWQTLSIRQVLALSMKRLATACATQPKQTYLLDYNAGVVDALTDLLMERGDNALSV